jgi:putative cardiolipin synthase
MGIQLLLAAACIFAFACSYLPKNIARTPATALELRADETKFGRMLAPDMKKHPGLSGFYIVPSDMDAFIARVALIDHAERSLDLQYFEVDEGDVTVGILVERLLNAADRGVRIRLLFDDYGTTVSDAVMWLLAGHPNIQLRLFNPVKDRTRGFTHSMQIFGSFSDYDHRMHNKSFIVDDTVTIVGGRNLGDGYFGGSEIYNFADMDVVATGPVVQEVSNAYDLFWNCRWAIPLEALVTKKPDAEGFRKTLAELKEKNLKAKDTRYAVRLKESGFYSQISQGKNPIHLIWAKGTVLHDMPEKVSEDLKDKDPNVYLATHLRPLIKGTKSEMILVAPYFVPGKKGLNDFYMLREHGVTVKVLTNSLSSTDEVAVHAGYTKYRKPLLKKGAGLFELRGDPSKGAKQLRSRVMGTSSGGLHAKFYVFDRKSAFIGSRNLDNRSNRINTEIGIYIESPEIAGQLADLFEVITKPQSSFTLKLSKDNKLLWITEEGGKEVIYDQEPMVSGWTRFTSDFYSVFAPESEL